MSHLTVTINNQTVMDGDTGQWSTNPPTILTDQLKANAHPAPWMRAIMLTVADAAMTHTDTRITVTTTPNEWTLKVKQ